MEYIWTNRNTYFLKFDKNTKRFSVDYIPDDKAINKRCCVLNHTQYVKLWTVRRCVVLILLKDGSYLFVSDRIYHFNLYPGDMIIRLISGHSEGIFCIMTRFSTLLMNNNIITSLTDNNTKLPPELTGNFMINEDFYFDKTITIQDYEVIHNGSAMKHIFQG